MCGVTAGNHVHVHTHTHIHINTHTQTHTHTLTQVRGILQLSRALGSLVTIRKDAASAKAASPQDAVRGSNDIGGGGVGSDRGGGERGEAPLSQPIAVVEQVRVREDLNCDICKNRRGAAEGVYVCVCVCIYNTRYNVRANVHVLVCFISLEGEGEAAEVEVARLLRR